MLTIPKSPIGILSFLWRKKTLIALVGLLTTIGVQQFMIRGYKIDILKLENELDKEKAKVKECRKEIDDQNQKIKEESEKGKQIEEQVSDLQEDLDATVKKNTSLIEELRKEQLENSCEAISQYLRDNLER